jgi:leucyl aminopeptidase
MKIELSPAPAEMIEADALAAVVFESPQGPPGGRLNELTGGRVSELIESGELRGKPFETALLHHPSGLKVQRLLLVGGGKPADFDLARLRQAAGVAVRTLKPKGIKRLALLPAGELPLGDEVRALSEGAILGDYEPDAYKTENEDAGRLESVFIAAEGAHLPSLERGIAVAESQNFTRRLVNEPGNRLPPRELAKRAIEMAHQVGLESDILDLDRLVELKMGALLGVAQGSSEPPCLIVIRYRPPGETGSKNHLGLVGKAVTFDTGGISIKPAENMDKMKYDMAGGGAMLGAMRALAALKPAMPVTAFVPAVENMPGSRAQRPGDVVTTMSGKTVEVLNTDAEGRLILADALTYAQRQGCSHLVDAATLTGAIVVALGNVRAGVFTNNEAWRDQLLASAAAAGEKMWPMPLDEEYKEQLKSIIADIPNIGSRWGGAVTAAMFLKQFADPTPWVHLDIAGTAWLEEAKPYLPKGPSGIGVRTLCDLAMHLG